MLIAAEARFLLKGYTATTVDEICHDAGATKGAFFHHFKSKKDIVLEALDLHAAKRFDGMLGGAVAGLGPRGRVLAYVDRMRKMAGSVEQPACLIAAMTLELSDIHPEVNQRVGQAFRRWTQDLVPLLEAALPENGPTAESVAHFVMSTFQGALVVARAKRSPVAIEDAMAGLRTYLESVLVIDVPARGPQ